MLSIDENLIYDVIFMFETISFFPFKSFDRQFCYHSGNWT